MSRPPPAQSLGSVRGAAREVVTDDGVTLHVEVDEPAAPTREAKSRLTVVLIHGYALNLDCWHFQRLALRRTHRLVSYDQRSHGRSGRSSSEHCTIEQLGRDLAAVLDQVTGPGPVAVVGHSMGAMAIMALAEHRPEEFGTRVRAVAMISTTAGGLDAEALGLPGLPGRFLQRLTPALIATLAKAPRLVDTGRRASSGIALKLTRRLAFGGPVDDEIVDFTDVMLAGTPFQVVADFFPGVEVHDKTAMLHVLKQVPTVVMCGSLDAITPMDSSRQIIASEPSVDLVEIVGAGHMVILERPAEVTTAIGSLLARSEVDA